MGTTERKDQEPSKVRPDIVLIPTEGMTPDDIDAVADEMVAALLPAINAWREKNGLPPLAE